MIPKETIEDWVKNKKRIQDRLNRIRKRLKKYNKQLVHYELRLKLIKQHENRKGQADVGAIDSGKPDENSPAQS